VELVDKATTAMNPDRLDGGRGLPPQLLIIAGIVQAEQLAPGLLRLRHQPPLSGLPGPRRTQ
jgi:hypothetical protein